MNKMYYSKQTGGFYAQEIHGDNIPSDAMEITAEQHAELLQGQSEGKRIEADENGYPILVDPPAPTAEQLAAHARSKRDALLRSTDWTQVPDAPVNQQDWATYRQALRDITLQDGFPKNINWPVEP